MSTPVALHHPAAGPTGRRRRMLAPVLSLSALALVTGALHLRDPHQHASWGLCPSGLLGIACPGCGGLRAVNDLTRGDLAAAASSNLVLVVAMPFLVAALAVWTLDRWRGTRTRLAPSTTRVLWPALVVVVAVFTVLRNLPAGAWLAP